MPDYLGEVSNKGRTLAIVCLTASTLIFGTAFLGVLGFLTINPPADAAKFRALVGQVLVAGAFSGTSLWMLVRVLRRARAQNGITSMPIWFIEIAGALLMCGFIAANILRPSPLLVGESISVLCAMIFVRRLVRQRLSQTESLDAPLHCGRADDDPPLREVEIARFRDVPD